MTVAATLCPLNESALRRAAAGRAHLPAYDRRQTAIGVVHLGPGAFHRAHQAAYFDDLLGKDPRWAIAGVSLRSNDVARALGPQDALYTLAILDETVSYRIIGSMKEIFCGAQDPARALARLSAPETRLVTLTVTEKGYCLGPDGALDFNHADIRRDLEAQDAPASAIGWIVAALRRRKAARARPFVAMSCDNLAGNGEKLKSAVVALARARDAELARWIEGEARFPSTMVDAITPATNDALRKSVAEATGYADAWPVQREAFASFVIEDGVDETFPDLGGVGAVMTSDVAAHERAKLRMLNGAHSTLAYLGLACGHETVGEAMRDLDLAAFIDDMMRLEIAPSLKAPRGLDLDDYRRALLKRFRNPAIQHRLAQIAWDGSQKLPIRLLGTIADNLAARRPIARLAAGVAAWMRFVRRAALARRDIVDPMAMRLSGVGLACTDEPAADVDLFLTRTAIAPPALAADPAFRKALEGAYKEVMSQERAA